MHTSAFLTAVLGAGLASAQLNQLAIRAGLEYFGTAVGEGQTSRDQQYVNVLSDTREFGMLVPENGQKWDSTESSQGRFNYANGDIVANLARRNGQKFRCHTLVWHSQLPSWVANGSWNRQSLQQVMQTHINNVMGHYRGQCRDWDVLNEAVGDDNQYRNSVFYRVFGTDYFALSFQLAKAADPNVKLYYNDYNLEYNGAKTNKVMELVQIIQRAGAPIEGVGFQGHLIVGTTPSRANLAATLRRFTALGLEVAYTELDIRHEQMPPSQQARNQQGNDYANVVGSCLDVKGCVGVTVWGFTDKYSWIPGTFPGTGDALIMDSNFQKKPAYYSVSSLLAAAAATAAPSQTQQPTTFVTTVAPPLTTSTEILPPPSTTTYTPPDTGAQAARWGQCGGLNWNGPTRCQSPYTCQELNPWYHQCL